MSSTHLVGLLAPWLLLTAGLTLALLAPHERRRERRRKAAWRAWRASSDAS